MIRDFALSNWQCAYDMDGIPKMGDSQHRLTMLLSRLTIPKRWHSEVRHCLGWWWKAHV